MTDVVVLRAKARDVRTIASLLRPIALSKICQVNISRAGLQVTTELNGVLQAVAYVGRGMFDEYTFVPPPSRSSETETLAVTQNDADSDVEDDEPFVMFDVSLDTWLTSLNIYGTASGFTKEPGQGVGGADVMRRMPFGKGRSVIEMTYGGKGHPLRLDIQEGKVKTRCELATYEINTVVISNMPFFAERTVGQVIIQSKELTEALQSIDSSSSRVTFAFTDDRVRFDGPTDTPRTPFSHRNDRRTDGVGGAAMLALSQSSHDVTTADRVDTRAAMRDALGVEMMRISAVGDMGSTELEFPNRNKVFESFTFQYPSQHTYAYTNIQHCLRAVQTSLKTSIRIDDQGMMSMQCLFPERPQLEREVDMDMSGPERRGFVEIRILPAFDEDL